ncbi:MAG: gamma carbonic anhydrase family protein, partial [Deltaproteobacteria bacterium]
AIVLDNALIGSDTIIGAGALVTEGADIPPGSLVIGVPGKVVRALRPEEMERIRRSAMNYIEYSKNYMGHTGA